jgi:aspartyl-tRNA(Asn)/glutamyl-tRNA(Gln) amidotransferase subunit B
MIKDKGYDHARITPVQLAGIIGLVDSSTISGSAAKQVFEDVFTTGKEPEAVVEEKGLAQVSDEGAIEDAVKEVLDASPDQVKQFKDGNEKVLGYLVGQVMKATKGKANPRVVNEILRKLLAD